MHIILTHEQADFDAMGAMLGASLLEEKAIPILPRRMNRNLRAFFSLYGGELAFIEPQDLPAKPITQVLLVDTQSFVTLRGMSTQASIRVLDHHQIREDLPPNWKINVDQVGACTTLLVEELQHHAIQLSTVTATLMLLGIYEDTGALTYTSTTVRDIRAAAYLLEQGASLNILGEYLNPPLSSDQRVVFDRLLSVCETLQIKGQKIIVSRTNADDLIEELSSIAHKMRDLLEPDGLFILANTVEGIRMVARSTTDRIDVSKIAAQFGGGGHSRAAASLLKIPTNTPLTRDELLDQSYRQLVDMLPAFISPPITVGQIMSRGPLVLSSQTTVQDVAQLMQRYGYEGYPIVQDNRVIGLLTRRAVDRALGHKLKVTAGSLMEAGEVTVSPKDSVEHLQHVMNSSGWGQVPVVSPETGEIVGIVTRTDLLKTLSGNGGAIPGELNLSKRLEAALPPARLTLLTLIAEMAHARRLAIYIVGGFVRDLLLNHPGVDFDLVVEGDAITLARALADKFGGRVVSHSRFGTAKWWIADIRESLASQLAEHGPMAAADLPESLDLISARTEFYDYPTALPTVERSSIKLDLHRRDFTINTMAMRLDGKHYGELYDYWGGLNDLQRGLIRVLHSLSFVDDPTRMLRAVRFEQRFNFQIENRSLQLMEEARPLLRQVSGDRIRHELDLVISEEKPEIMFLRLNQLNLLHTIHPDLEWPNELNQYLPDLLNEPIGPEWKFDEELNHSNLRRMLIYSAWMGTLSEEKIVLLNERLKFSRDMRNVLLSASRLRHDFASLLTAQPSEIVSRLDSVPQVVLYIINRMDPPGEIRYLIQRYIFEWQKVRPLTNGKTLRSMGIKQGPIYSQILCELRNAWLDGKISSIDDEKVLLAKMVEQNSLGAVAASGEQDYGEDTSPAE
jgi:tRNA nucleotidyltransferase (CCA-adding enzyme)